MSNDNIKLASTSTKKVFASFKSPCQVSSDNTKITANKKVFKPIYNVTPRPIDKKRKRVLASSFISPLKKKVTKTKPTQENIVEIEKQIQDQENEIKELQCQGLDTSDLDTYIDKLHQYNEIKDVGQLLIGRLALQKESTTSELYLQFGLSLDD